MQTQLTHEQEQLVLKFQSLPHHIWKSYPWFRSNRHIRSNKEDYIQEGMMALIRASRGYDPTRKNKRGSPVSFKTYAYWAVLNAMTNYLNMDRPITLPRTISGHIHKDLSMQLIEKIANIKFKRPIYFNVPDKHKTDPDVSLDVDTLLSRLDSTEQLIVREWFLNNKTYREIGKILNISGESVRLKFRVALYKLKGLKPGSQNSCKITVKPFTDKNKRAEPVCSRT